jgi:molybdate transport system substrate-binding protein
VTGPATITVSAAADLTSAFQEIARAYEAETGTKVALNFGSTGQLAQQIERGAPVDVFAAADVSYVDGLERENLIIPETRTLYARGRLTLWTRAESPLRIESLTDLARPEVQRVAIANPDHAPYGAAARDALRQAGVWDVVQPKLVLGENVAQTLQFAETGNVDVAIVALSLSVQSQGRWVLVPQELHAPIDQALAVVKGTKHEREARGFVSFVGSREGREVMRRYGFTLPGEEGTK